MVIVAFKPGEKEISKYEELDQYDYGQILRIQGLNLPQAVEIHFALQKTGGTSKTRIGITKDGVTDVPIPDSMLENEDETKDYDIYAFIYITDETSGQTEYRIALKVKARPKPEIPGGGDNPDIFHEAVEAVSKAMEAAAESERRAEGWAHGREDLPERAEDNAKYYAGKAHEDAEQTTTDRKEVERLVESVSGIEEQVEKVDGLTKQAQKAATDAGLYKEAAENARKGAETAKTEAETAAGKTAEDKAAVETARGEVLKAQEAVSTDRKAVESIKSGIEQLGGEITGAVGQGMQELGAAKQQAVQAIEQTGTAQKSAVEASGKKAVQSIENIKQTATEAVEVAKSEAVQAVQTEGTTQAGNVSAEGEKQVQAVRGAAQEIIADREQIQMNKEGVAKLKEDIGGLQQGKADAIVETASGTLLNIRDGADAFFEDFKLLGKTVQDGTPTPDASVEIVNAGESGNIEIKVTGKNLIDEKEIYKTDTNYFISYKRFGGKGIDLKARTPYTFSVNNNVDGMYISLYSDTTQDLTKIYGQQKLTYTPEKDVKVQLLLFREKKMIEGTTTQLEIGTIATAYEPYKEPQTITLQLDSPLTKWDRLEKREGIWGIARQSGREILDGTEDWEIDIGKTHVFKITNSRLILEGICTHYKTYGAEGVGAKTGVHLTYTRFIIVTDFDFDNLEDFKAWLMRQKEAGTPVEIVYKTEETWEPLPEEMQLALNALHTNYPTTIVTDSEDTEMQLTYVADTKNYYLGREQAIQKQILEIQNALISQKISGGV